MGKLKLPRLTIAAVILYVFIQALNLTGLLNGYFMIIINQSLIFVIFTVSLNLINGITGQFSLGHMGFAAVGAYVSGTITTLIFKLSPDVASNYPIFIGAILLGGVIAALAGMVIGFPSLRLRGDYLAIMTLGFGEVIRIILNNIDYVGGPRGLLGVPEIFHLHGHLRLHLPHGCHRAQSHPILHTAGRCCRSGRTKSQPSWWV